MKANKTQKLRGERKAYTRPKMKVYQESIADIICASVCAKTYCTGYGACSCNGPLE